MPPTAAITGTLSCTLAALAGRSPGSALYQIAYPTPEASAPEAIA